MITAIDAMTPEHEAHLQRIKDVLTRELDQKYRAGQVEHGGRLWEKPGMLDEAINEVIDLAVYLLTLKEQNLRRASGGSNPGAVHVLSEEVLHDRDF